MQDRLPPARRNHLQRTAGPYIRVNRLGLTASEPLLPGRSGHGIHLFLGAPLQAGGSLLGWEYALIDRARLLNETRAIKVALRDELYNFAHFAHHSRKFRGSLSSMMALTR
jgi:hypothetical protein